jgi:hypothetical protein
MGTPCPRQRCKTFVTSLSLYVEDRWCDHSQWQDIKVNALCTYISQSYFSFQWWLYDTRTNYLGIEPCACNDMSFNDRYIYDGGPVTLWSWNVPVASIFTAQFLGLNMLQNTNTTVLQLPHSVQKCPMLCRLVAYMCSDTHMGLCRHIVMFSQWQNHLTMRFSEYIPVIKGCLSVYE